MSKKRINLFISYSHESEEHKKWVLDLADHLTNHGVYVILDQYDLKLGKDMHRFMERAVEDSDYIAVICTPDYCNKSKIRKGGVGFEYGLITTDLYQEMHLDEGYIIPILRKGNRRESTPTYLKPLVGLDMTSDNEFDNRAEELLRKVYDEPEVRRPPLGTKPDFDKITTTIKLTIPSMKNKAGELEYDDPDVIAMKIKDNFTKYFDKVFTLDDKGNTIGREAKVKLRFAAWEEDILEYTENYSQQFEDSKIEKFVRKPQIFKTSAFQTLWTVGAALRTPDLELLNYKTAYAGVKPKALLSKFLHITSKADDYVKHVGSNLKFDDIVAIADLQQGFFDDEEMYLRGVIGLGIRSEFLHKAYPHIFSIMTRRSHWGMFFLTGHAHEFVRYEEDKRKGKTRYVNEYEYHYPRFNYHCNAVYKCLVKEADSCQINLNDNLRFGYVNLFLRDIALMHNDDYSEMHKWK